MNKILFLNKFNNYFNRIIKKYETREDYIAHSQYSLLYPSNNFNPNDGITTTFILGKGQPTEFMLTATGVDYVVVLSESDDPETIVSRWFVMETRRTRGNQYELVLRRDVIADNFNSLLTCPAFIQRGMIQDNNPLILNDEGMSFNEIKQEEILLKDDTESAWAVAYVAKDTFAESVSVQIPDESFVNYTTLEEIAQEKGVPIATLTSLFDGATHKYISGGFTFKAWVNWPDNTNTENYISSYRNNDFSANGYQQGMDVHNPTSDCFAKLNYRPDEWQYNYKASNAAGRLFTNAINDNLNGLKALWSSFTSNDFVSEDLINYLSTLSKPIYVNGQYKRVVITPQSTRENKYSLPITGVLSTIVNDFATAWNNGHAAPNYKIYDIGGGRFFLNNVKETDFVASLETIATPGVQVNFSTTHNVIGDQVYDIIAIPVNRVDTLYNPQEDVLEIANNYALKIMQSLAISQKEKIYDVQLLPYCPVPELVTDGAIDLRSARAGYDYDYIKINGSYSGPFIKRYDLNPSSWTVTGANTIEQTITNALPLLTVSDSLELDVSEGEEHITDTLITRNNRAVTITLTIDDILAMDDIVAQLVVTYHYGESVTIENPSIGVVLYPKKASFSVNINEQLALRDSMKIESQCNKYRLCSPNYQGSFEFNLAKNGGSCSGFIAECTYKPYTPYIKVVPQLSWMYGTNFGDCRGLICGGDFSLPRLNSAWEDYEFQNKNYQNIFNREIQSLDIQQDIFRRQQYVSGAIGQFVDSAKGFGAGAMAGPWGAAIGATVMGGASTAGYAVDMPMMEQQLVDQRQLVIDKFNYQLGNIKALPYTITKVGAFDINSKIWPFLEYYTCSQEEKDALQLKIDYQSMTVMRVDTLDKYMGSGFFTKAELIRNENIGEDAHMFNEIYNELMKGVYA